jgi:hypothetical protein
VLAAPPDPVVLIEPVVPVVVVPSVPVVTVLLVPLVRVPAVVPLVTVLPSVPVAALLLAAPLVVPASSAVSLQATKVRVVSRGKNEATRRRAVSITAGTPLLRAGRSYEVCEEEEGIDGVRETPKRMRTP